MSDKKPKKPKISGLNASDAVARAAQYAGQDYKSGMCQQFAEESILGHGGVYNSATDYYNWANKNKSVKTSAPPAGVPVFYAGSSNNKYGHVAVSAGGGYVYSTDVGGKVAKVPYNKLWGGTGSGQYLGWTGAIQSTKGGKASRIGYDPATVGKAPTVKVPKMSSTSAAASRAGSTSTIDSTPAGSPEAGTANLSQLQPNISKQFSGIVGGGNIPKVG